MTTTINDAEWESALNRITERLLDERDPEQVEELAVRLHFVALKRQGVACPVCRGLGRRDYGHSTTWRREGMGVDGINIDVCDSCWGTGRTDRTGANLRELRSERKRLEQETSRRWLEQRLGAQYESCRKFFPLLAGKLRRLRFPSPDAFWAIQAAEIVAQVLEELAQDFETKEQPQ